MGKLEDHYLKIAADEAAEKLAKEVEENNAIVDKLLELLPKVFKMITNRKPTDYDWVVINGEKCIAWYIYNDSDPREGLYAKDQINMMQNGDLISSSRGHSGSEWVYVGRIYIRRISINEAASLTNEIPDNSGNRFTPLYGWMLKNLLFQLEHRFQDDAKKAQESKGWFARLFGD